MVGVEMKKLPKVSHRMRSSLKVILVTFVIACVWEFGLCNLSHWETLGSQTSDVLTQPTVLQSAKDSLTFSDLDTAVQDVRITVASPDGSATDAQVALWASDEGNNQPYYVTQMDICSSNDRSMYQTIHLYGHASSLTLSGVDDATYPVYITSVQLNATVPFTVYPVRFFFVWILCLCLYALRPGSSIWSKTVSEASRTLNRGMAGLSLGLCMIALALMFVNPAYLGVSNQSDVSDGSDAGSTTPAWYNEDAQREYDELADSLLSGSVCLPEEPPAWLAQIDNPYDPSVRDAMESQTGEAYFWDAAYHNGSYYVYFGIVPCLLFFVPFHLITHGMPLPTGWVVAFCTFAAIIGTAMLLRYGAKRYFPRSSVAAVLLAFAGCVLSMGFGYALLCPSLYQIPVTLAIALAVWGLYAWLRAWNEHSVCCTALGSIAIACILGTRPPLAIVAVFGIVLLASAIKHPQHRAATLTALIAPFICVGIGLACYNAARFGSPTDFGAGYNLTVVDMTLRGFAFGRIGDGIYTYLLQPPTITAVFPFLQPADMTSAFGGMNYVEPMPGGAFACMPFLWLILVAGLIRDRRAVLSVVSTLVAATLILVVLDTQVGGLVARYQLDFCFLLAIAAAVVAIGVSQRIRDISRSADERAVTDDETISLVDKSDREAMCCNAAVTNESFVLANRQTMRSLSYTARGLLVGLVLVTAAFDVLFVLFMIGGSSAPTGPDSLLAHPGIATTLKQMFQFWV